MHFLEYAEDYLREQFETLGEDSLEAESFEDNDTPGRSVFDDVDA